MGSTSPSTTLPSIDPAKLIPFIQPKLKGEVNYTAWCCKVESTFKMYRVHKYLGTKTKEGVQTQTQKDAAELQEQLAAVMLSCMEEPVWDKFRKCSS